MFDLCVDLDGCRSFHVLVLTRDSREVSKFNSLSERTVLHSEIIACKGQTLFR